jgi:putative peptidoglycan lipid II flippase
MGLLKATSTIGGLTLISRILGMVRDMLVARFLGAGLASDAFLIAWRLPNLFRALFAEGAFAAVFVPMFNRTMAEGDRDAPGSGKAAAVAFAGQILSILFPVLVLFTGLMMVLAAPVVWAMTGGFPDGGPAKFDLAVTLTRITFPYLALISLVSLLGGILNSLDRFWVNAAAPVLLNLCMIGAVLFFRGATPIETAHTQAIAVTVSGVLQLLWLTWACRRAGVVLRLQRPRLSPQVRRLLSLIGPAALGEGAVSYLYYADRLNQLPLGLIGIGVGTAILPALSRQIGSGNEQAASHTQNRAMELALFLALPAAVALCLSATPLIRGLLQHGAFTANDTIGAAGALAAFALGVPAYVLIKVLTPGFYARQDTKTPVRVAVFSMLFNLVGNLTLIWPFGHVGVAISTAIAAWVNVLVLYWLLHRRDQLRMDARFRGKALRIILASAIMGAALLLLNPLVDPYMAGSVTQRIIALGLLCGIGGLVYGAAALIVRAYSISELRGALRRAPKAS